MKITKFGHCCLLIETKKKRILTDPGAWSVLQNEVQDIDIILITHEHADHVHVESLQTILDNNKNAKVFTNSGVGKILKEKGINFTLLENGDKYESDILIESMEGKHEEIYENLGQVQNTGYFIESKFFYPGDSFTLPEKKVIILAAPIVAPWASFRECVDYIKRISPKVAIPVHDGMLKEEAPGPTYRLPPQILEPLGIRFEIIKPGEEKDFSDIV
jgi:L-ascorbate metabolism protein UlaG (beta-lactamase superfamily)